MCTTIPARIYEIRPILTTKERPSPGQFGAGPSDDVRGCSKRQDANATPACSILSFPFSLDARRARDYTWVRPPPRNSRLLKKARLRRWRTSALAAAYLQYASLGLGYPSDTDG